jgi:hypothetical protein
MRHHYLLDGSDGGVLSVTESKRPRHVTLCVEHNGLQLAIDLNEDTFRELADLRYQLRFIRPEIVSCNVA